MTFIKKLDLMWLMIGFGTCTVFASFAIGADKKTELNLKSPKDACNTIVQAAKNDDFETVKRATAQWSHPGHPGKDNKKNVEKKFHEMHDDYASTLKEISCGSENIADAHAFVEAKSKDEKRFIPFVRENAEWKFDVRTYTSFYRVKMPGAGGGAKAGG